MSAESSGSGRSGSFAAVSAGSAAAAHAAMSVLRDGGNAVDAAIAGSAVQCVVEMPWCGLGGDGFAVIRLADGQTLGVNGSGVAPHRILDALGDLPRVPRFGPLSVAVPAVVDAWAGMHRRFGSVPLADLLEPARVLAVDGVRLDARLLGALREIGDLEHGEQLLPLVADADLSPGALFRQRDLGETIAAIAAEGPAAFYHGEIAKRMVEHLAERGGALSRAELEDHACRWGPTLSASYRGNVVHTNAPVSMGVLLLLALRVVEHCFPRGVPDDVATTDALVRLKLLLFGEVLPRLGDPAVAPVPDVLDDELVRDLAGRLHRGAPTAPVGDPGGTDTTSIAVSAPDGSSVTFIHSLFNEFGARELVPGTGIVLNDRLANLRPDGAPNALAPGKRPMHTLHAYLVDHVDGSRTTGATPGGRGQVQTNLQVLIDVIDRGLDPQAAVSRPRWVSGVPRRSPEDRTLYLEAGLSGQALPLRDLGHDVEIVPAQLDDMFGNCSVVGRLADGSHVAAADHRRAGHAEVW